MKLIANKPVIFRVKGQLLAFDAGAPLEVTPDVYKILAEDALFKGYQKDGTIKIDQTKPPDTEPEPEPTPTPSPSKK